MKNAHLISNLPFHDGLGQQDFHIIPASLERYRDPLLTDVYVVLQLLDQSFLS